MIQLEKPIDEYYNKIIISLKKKNKVLKKENQKLAEEFEEQLKFRVNLELELKLPELK